MLKLLKQELIFIPLLMLLLEGFRAGVTHFYPDTALFDRGSLLESFLVSLWEITWISAGAWLVLWVIFPPAYKTLKKFYLEYEQYKADYKDSFSQKLWLVIFLSLVFLVGMRGATPDHTLRLKLKDTLYKQLNVREATGRNDGLEVERYLNFVGQTSGASWCAAFTSYNLHAVGIDKPINPVSAWSPSFSNRYVIWSEARVKSRTALSPQTGDCFTLYYPSLGRIGHVGFIVGSAGQYYVTVEGNTAVGGSRDGSGVHSLKRAKAKIYTASDFITPYLKQNEKSAIAAVFSSHDTVLLPQAYTKHGNKHRAYKRQYKYSPGLNLFHRSDSKTQGGSIALARDSVSRRSMHPFYGYGVYRDYHCTSLSFNFKRAAECGLQMQGQGGSYCCAKSANKKASDLSTKAKNRKYYCKGSNRTGSTETC